MDKDKKFLVACAFCDFKGKNDYDLMSHAMDEHPEKFRRPIEGEPAPAPQAATPACSVLLDKAIDVLREWPLGHPLRYAAMHIYRQWCEMKDSVSQAGASQAATPEDMLRNLLAVIHGDGGHYTNEYGLGKSSSDAEARVVTWLSQAEAPRPSAPTVEDEYDQRACDVIKNLATLVRRLGYKHPNTKLVDQALGYLRGEGLGGSCLRTSAESRPSAEEVCPSCGQIHFCGKLSKPLKL
jgi:hypothetical protein